MLIYRFYLTILFLARPFIYLHIYWRVFKGKEDPKRLEERFGKTSVKRPEGRLIWVHGASVGETLSAIPLIEEMQKQDKNLKFLITSVTITSANLLKKRLPKGIIHQFVPLDLPSYTDKFLDHWKPRLALRVDSEIWPVAIKKLADRGIPHIMVNARISNRSFKKFMKYKSIREFLFSRITACFAKSKKETEYFKKLGIKHVEQSANLKLSALLPEPTKKDIAQLKKEINGRPFWLAASTGGDQKEKAEETFILSTHIKLKKEKPTLLTLISLRHPKRAEEVIGLIKKAGLTYVQRSKDEKPTAKTDIYLMDTFGEMPLLYTVAEIVFTGRSLVKWGGNTPIEPAGMKCAILVGPYTFNFDELYKDLEKHKAIIRVKNEKELYTEVKSLFKDKTKRSNLIKAAYNYIKDKQKTANRLSKRIAPFLKPIAWAIIDNRMGTTNQVRGITSQLEGFKIIEKNVEYTWEIKLPNILHSIFGSPHSTESEKLFSGQTPDLIISGGRRTASISVHLKKRYPNALNVQVLKPNLPLKNFDFVVLPEHDSGEKTSPKILTYIGAMHRFTAPVLTQAKKEWTKEFKPFKKPRIAVLIGGSTKSRTFSEKDAETLARVLAQTKKDLKGSLLITTSRRTGEKQTEILRKNTNADYFYAPEDKKENPYVGFLGSADILVVTGESVSMLSEATGAKKPLFIYAPKSLLIPKHQRFVDKLYKLGVAKPFGNRTLKPFTPKAFPAEGKRLAKIIMNKIK
ncbi:MAG: ELM1/GtrOC1 family putative glycosyltransferase [Alphaproteobacteria bacterium]